MMWCFVAQESELEKQGIYLPWPKMMKLFLNEMYAFKIGHTFEQICVNCRLGLFNTF